MTKKNKKLFQTINNHKSNNLTWAQTPSSTSTNKMAPSHNLTTDDT